MCISPIDELEDHGDNESYQLVLNNLPLVLITMDDFCDACMANPLPIWLDSRRKAGTQTPQLPLHVQQRVQGVWRRLAQNPGLVLPSDSTEEFEGDDHNTATRNPFRKEGRRHIGNYVHTGNITEYQDDVNYLVVIMQDLQ
jgi:hypothetical protein